MATMIDISVDKKKCPAATFVFSQRVRLVDVEEVFRNVQQQQHLTKEVSAVKTNSFT